MVLRQKSCLLRVHARYRQTDGQTDGNAISIAQRLLRNDR